MENRNRTVITAPVAGKNTWALDANDVAPATYIEVPVAWKNSVLEFHADGEDFVFTFGGDSLTTITATGNSTISSNAISAQGTVGYYLANGDRVSVDLTKITEENKTRLAVLALTGTTNNDLRITRVDGYVR